MARRRPTGLTSQTVHRPREPWHSCFVREREPCYREPCGGTPVSRKTPLFRGCVPFGKTKVLLSDRPNFSGRLRRGSHPLGGGSKTRGLWRGGSVATGGTLRHSSTPSGGVNRRPWGHGGQGGPEPRGVCHRSGLEQVWSRFGSGLARLGSKVVQFLFRFGSGLARLGSKTFQIRVRCVSGLAQGCSKVIWFRFGSDLVQIWFGSAWLKGASDLVQI